MAITSTYLGRYLLWLRPTNRDHLRMPQRRLRPSPAAKSLPVNPIDGLDRMPVRAGRSAQMQPLAQLLQQTGTTALLVVHRGRIVAELYPNGGSRDRQNRCFSVTKSVASVLVGAAIGEKLITSLEDPLRRYLPEIASSPIGDLTLAHLLEMRSGMRFVEGLFPWNDEPRTYYATDLRSRLLRIPIGDPVGKFFHYIDWHPQLIALVLERVSGISATAFLQRCLWDPLGCEYPASMMVDRDDHAGVEHLESGLTATAIDLARFGQFVLQDGVWNGRRLLPEGWVRSTTAPCFRDDPDWFAYYSKRPWGRFLASGVIYYGRMWWGHRLADGNHDFFAMGVLGQHVYVSPDSHTVIVRLSDRFPAGMWWPPLFRQIIDAVVIRAHAAT